jgi:hypothetical protein
MASTPISSDLTEIIGLMGVFFNSPVETSLEDLVHLLKKLKSTCNGPIEDTLPVEEKNAIKNSTPLIVVNDLLFKWFQRGIYGADANLIDPSLLADLKDIIPNPNPPPPLKPSETSRPTTPTGWSSTKKALVFGGSGLGILLVIGLGLFFAFGKSRVASSAA